MTAFSDLSFGSACGQLAVQFRPLDGATELRMAEAGGSAEQRARLLITLLSETIRRDGEAIPTGELTITEFDALLVHLQSALGDPIAQCRARCNGCGEDYEFSLALAALLHRTVSEAADVPVHGGIADFRESGRRIRVPRVGDLERLPGEKGDNWLRGLLVEGPYAPEMEAEVARAAPVLSQDLSAACPHCGAGNTVRFDIADFVLRTLAAETPFLWREVHLIARCYGWSLAEILSLPRDARRRLSGFVVADSSAMRLAS